MTHSEAHDLLWELVNMYFSDANVIFAKQSRSAKPSLPLVVILPGNTERLKNPNYDIGSYINPKKAKYSGRYQITEDIEIDLFSKGKPVMLEDKIIAFENSAQEEMLAFIDFVNKESTDNWCSERELSLEIDGNITNETSVLNDSSYEFKARINCKYKYWEDAVGHKYETGELIDDASED